MTFSIIIPQFPYFQLRLESRSWDGGLLQNLQRELLPPTLEVLEPLRLLDYSLYPCCRDDARLHGATEIINAAAGHRFPSAPLGDVLFVDAPPQTLAFPRSPQQLSRHPPSRRSGSNTPTNSLPLNEAPVLLPPSTAHSGHVFATPTREREKWLFFFFFSILHQLSCFAFLLRKS